MAKFCYGRFLYYPKNETALELCKTLTHSTTITLEQVEFLAALGVKIHLGGLIGLKS